MKKDLLLDEKGKHTPMVPKMVEYRFPPGVIVVLTTFVMVSPRRN